VQSGTVVVIDPGHNGANSANPDIINALVPAGFGQTKPCNTTGTSTNDGYPEHQFTWKVANYLRPMLEARGITVVMTRGSDAGVGPCVDKRAAVGNDNNADVVVSIHGDGDDGSAHGYYVMTAEQDPAGAAMADQSHSLAVNVRDGLTGAGLSPSNHLGSAGLWPRGDLAGLNLSVRPTVMIEAGNMRNYGDADLMSSAAGQQQIAQGLANGVLAYLGA
jgi:N-acetylmuramoyl-L-alanine amidase